MKTYLKDDVITAKKMLAGLEDKSKNKINHDKALLELKGSIITLINKKGYSISEAHDLLKEMGFSFNKKEIASLLK